MVPGKNAHQSAKFLSVNQSNWLVLCKLAGIASKLSGGNDEALIGTTGSHYSELLPNDLYIHFFITPMLTLDRRCPAVFAQVKVYAAVRPFISFANGVAVPMEVFLYQPFELTPG